MRIGVVGLGKVGLPLALTLAYTSSHDVIGYDLDLDTVRDRLAKPHTHPANMAEQELGWLITQATIRLASTLDQLVDHADLVMVVVPTPHPPGYDGTREMPALPRDFDYSPLREAVRQLSTAAAQQDKDLTICVVSTVSPGTHRTILRPQTNHLITLAYTPVLISLGRVYGGLTVPPFGLVGHFPDDDIALAESAIQSLHSAPVWTVPIETAEITKMAHNCWVSTQIAFVNELAQMCHTVGNSDIDHVTSILSEDLRELPRAGLGDGGACRPRDAITMAAVADRLKLAPGIYRWLTRSREQHNQWVARMAQTIARANDLRIFVLGTAYRAGIPYEFGSPALHLADALDHPGSYDPLVDPPDGIRQIPTTPRVFVVGTPHPETLRTPLPAGSIVVDPWGTFIAQEGVKIVRLGRGPAAPTYPAPRGPNRVFTVGSL